MLSRKTPLKRGAKRMSRGQRINPLGPKTSTWEAVRKELKVEFAQKGIELCEFRYEGCWHSQALSFAHAVKRVDLDPDAPLGAPENIRTVALACIPVCHRRLDEEFTHEQMREAVMAAIARRGNDNA